MLIIKEEKGRKDGEIFVELTRNRDLNVSDCDRLGYWCDKPHLEHFFHTLASMFEYEELEVIFSKILKRKQKFEPKDGDIIVYETKDETWIHINKKPQHCEGDLRSSIYNVYAVWNQSDDFLHIGEACYVHYGSKKRPATEEEKQILFDKLKKVGKRWNPEKKRIEDIPEEPKIGDYVIAWQNNRKHEAIVGIIDNKDSSFVPYKLADHWYPNAILWNGTREHLEKVRKGEV